MKLTMEVVFVIGALIQGTIVLIDIFGTGRQLSQIEKIGLVVDHWLED